jgi:hypothetical protein
MARAFFVLAPALFIGLLASLMHPVFGALAFAFIAGLGIQVTARRTDRGE